MRLSPIILRATVLVLTILLSGCINPAIYDQRAPRTRPRTSWEPLALSYDRDLARYIPQERAVAYLRLMARSEPPGQCYVEPDGIRFPTGAFAAYPSLRVHPVKMLWQGRTPHVTFAIVLETDQGNCVIAHYTPPEFGPVAQLDPQVGATMGKVMEALVALGANL